MAKGSTGDGDPTIEAIHNRIDLLESQVARLEKLLDRNSNGISRTIEITDHHGGPTNGPARPVSLHRGRLASVQDIFAPGWRSLLAGTGMLVTALIAVEVLG